MERAIDNEFIRQLSLEQPATKTVNGRLRADLKLDKASQKVAQANSIDETASAYGRAFFTSNATSTTRGWI